MLDMKWIRENCEIVRKGAADKRMTFDLDGLLAVDSQKKALQSRLEEFLAERNRLSKLVPKTPAEDRPALFEKVNALKSDIERLEKEIAPLERSIEDLLLRVPQPARGDVPLGRDDKDNVEVRRVGSLPQFDFEPESHVTLGAKLGIIDIERGVKLAGSRSYVLRGLGAQLENAVLRLTYDLLVERGYTAMAIPVLVGEEAMVGTGYFPGGREQAYCVEKDSLALVGTAEVSLTSFHSGEILAESDLPIRMMAQSSCFRREAGTYGKDTQGLYRVHQFQKIEQVVLCKNSVEESEKLHEELLKNAEDVLQMLGLAYRVVYVCTGDLGQGQLRKHDIETWMPSRDAYSETHSCSSFHEFQCRRLKIRYRDAEGKVQFCHSLNNTAIASPRVLIPLIENYQRKDGSIAIPKCLQKYMGGLKEIRGK